MRRLEGADEFLEGLMSLLALNEECKAVPRRVKAFSAACPSQAQNREFDLFSEQLAPQQIPSRQ